jgi:hypothetical protein
MGVFTCYRCYLPWTSVCNWNKLKWTCRELGDIHVSAREGATDDIVKLLAAGVEVNVRGLCLQTINHLMLMLCL